MKKIETIIIDSQSSYVLALQVIFLFFIGGAIFTGITGANDIDFNGGLAIVVYIATIIIHELLHGLGFLITKAKPRFGAGIVGILPYAYATSDARIKIPSMLFVAYLPFILISVIYILLALLYPQFQSLAFIGFLGNFTGAVGDIWIASKLLKYIRFNNTLVKDTKIGIEVFSTNDQAVLVASRSKYKENRNLRFGKKWAIASIVAFGVQLLAPIILAIIGYNNSFKLGFGELYLFETSVNSDGSASGASFNLLTPILIGLIFTMLSKVFMKLKRIDS